MVSSNTSANAVALWRAISGDPFLQVIPGYQSPLSVEYPLYSAREETSTVISRSRLLWLTSAVLLAVAGTSIPR